MAALLEMDCVKFQHHFDIRWLSLGGCLSALLRNYEPLLVMLSTEADMGYPTATGLFLYLTLCMLLVLINLMADVLGVTDHLGRIFQRARAPLHGVTEG